jgi:hypothetical protein
MSLAGDGSTEVGEEVCGFRLDGKGTQVPDFLASPEWKDSEVLAIPSSLNWRLHLGKGGLTLTYPSEWFKSFITLSTHSASLAASVVATTSASSPLSSLKSRTGSNRTNLSGFGLLSSLAGLQRMPFGAGLSCQRVGLLVAFRSGDRERNRD